MNDRGHRAFPLRKLFPNMITIVGLCCGLSAIRYAIDGRWEWVVGFIMAATILDGLDGRIARLLGVTSSFGAQLDSLSDFVSFGVAPVIALYLWILNDIPRMGWAVVMFFAVCCALRLARFNTGLLDTSRKPWMEYFFTGVPAPCGANLCMLPMVAWFEFGDGSVNMPGAAIAYTILVGLIMASTLPTYSIKHIKIRHDTILPIMVLCGGLIAFFIMDIWKAYLICGAIYLLLMPVSALHYLRFKRRDAGHTA